MILPVIFILINFASSAKILGFFYFPSISHQYVFRELVKELSLRGHEVTFITTNPIGDPNLKNLSEIDVSGAYQVFNKYDLSEINREKYGLIHISTYFRNFNHDIITIEMKTKDVQEVLKKPEDFYDLILIEAHSPISFGLGHKFKAPMVAVSSSDVSSQTHALFGESIHPVLYPELGIGYIGPLKQLAEKFDSFYINFMAWFITKYLDLPSDDQFARGYFGDDMPYLRDLMSEASLLLLNVNPIFSNRRPNAPNVIHYYNIHTKRNEDFPLDLQKILDDAKGGVVYFSLGTNVRFDHVQGNIKQAILEALGELPYTVLCKWESEDFPGKPKNVILRKWLPQQAILAHPNVKVFVTQGGIQSAEEAIANAVPLVIIPFLGDQPMNAKILTKHGMAETISPKLLEKNILRDTILKVISDEKYRKTAQELRSIFLDQPMSGIDKIIWWCEYVIRHKGAKHLRSPSADIPLYEYFMLDVFAVIFTALFVIYKIVSLAVRSLVGLLRGRKNQKEIKKKTS
ncbi:hypothetical protein WA026_018359 [Henosepilachna vigintioctopunctata]|uniref:UDP-glucuronosyltransferase n=1 Tax=Henosepilachna vigintioctopunctata TaxID=420089 RepID=A0AAW1VHA5_9CUCU